MPPVNVSRRTLIQGAAALPLLPLASALPAAEVAPGDARRAAAPLTSVAFVGMAAPTLDDPAAMATTTVGSQLLARYGDGSERRWQLGYETLCLTGDRVPDGAGGTVVVGGQVDIHGRPIMDTSVPDRPRQYYANCPDGSSLLTLPDARVAGVKGHTVFAVVQFEYTSRAQDEVTSVYGHLPSPMAVLTLDQNPDTGRLTLVKYHNVDTRSVHGLWMTCGASLSPWNTHLSSEEYEPDAFADREDGLLAAYSRNVFGDAGIANPYHYGHLPEVTVLPDGSGRICKHYGTGRISKELVQVMPDERTMLMGDDWTHGGAFMFVADTPRDLSAGTLYAAQWQQTSGEGPGRAALRWIRLGHARSAAIEALIDGGIKPTDIMDVRTADPQDARFTKIHYAGRPQWVRLKPGMAQAAAFLETHRYAALVGASLGFTKWEGTTVNAADKLAYLAMSRIETSMLDGSGGIQVQGPYSGAVYQQRLRGGQRDTSGKPIASEWVPVDMAAVSELVAQDLGATAERPYPKKAAQDALGNFAHPDRIASPDNLKFDPVLRTLFIGEDSNTHVNNFLWAFHVDTRQLTRLLSCPVGAESTGLHAVSHVNGWTYVMSHFQHAGDWASPLHDKVRAKVEPLIRANYKDRFGASIGYLTGVRTTASA